jgi:hypothetical protein
MKGTPNAAASSRGEMRTLAFKDVADRLGNRLASINVAPAGKALRDDRDRAEGHFLITTVCDQEMA